MAFTSHALSPRDVPFTSTPAAPRPGLLARFFRALHDARLRQAEREVAAYLAATGGKLTDSTEREIERRFLI
jgi:hypothetical protein